MIDEVVKYFKIPDLEVDSEEDADFMVITKLENGVVIGQDTLLSEKLAAELEGAPSPGLQETHLLAERGDLKQDLPASQAFTDESNIEVLPTVDAAEEGLHNTGKDLSRTGPGGLNPKDNYDSEHYQGQGDVKLNIPTPFYDGKKPHDVSGVVPEYQEDIRITIESPSKDEMVEKIVIDIPDEIQDLEKKLQPFDLKNHPGRKDPGTHINTIKAGEKGIDDLLPISELWKEGPSKDFNFSEAVSNPERFFEHPSSWIGNVRYFPESSKMMVSMNGKNYTHCSVTERDFDAFQGSPSKGEHWNRIFKNNNQCSQGLSEALNIYKHKQPDEFNWINDEEMERMRAYAQEHGKGRFILAVASGESVTDHRPEGVEQHRRRWSKSEMSQNIRTAKGKLIDINHQHSKIDPHSGGIYDANWNEVTERGEMMIWETDQVILDAIRNGIIEAVSINTGKPRRVETNCDTGECFIEPSGTILGEDNGVALAYVVTAHEGLDYHGIHIPGLPPGMKFTKIYLVE